MSLNDGAYDGLWGHDPRLRQSMFHMLCHLWLNLIHFCPVQGFAMSFLALFWLFFVLFWGYAMLFFVATHHPFTQHPSPITLHHHPSPNWGSYHLGNTFSQCNIFTTSASHVYLIKKIVDLRNFIVSKGQLFNIQVNTKLHGICLLYVRHKCFCRFAA